MCIKVDRRGVGGKIMSPCFDCDVKDVLIAKYEKEIGRLKKYITQMEHKQNEHINKIYQLEEKALRDLDEIERLNSLVAALSMYKGRYKKTYKQLKELRQLVKEGKS
jgi:hypothetical protein